MHHPGWGSYPASLVAPQLPYLIPLSRSKDQVTQQSPITAQPLNERAYPKKLELQDPFQEWDYFQYSLAH